MFLRPRSVDIFLGIIAAVFGVSSGFFPFPAPKSLMPHRSQRGRVLLVWNISSRFPSHLTLVREYDPKEQGEAAMVQSVAQTNVVGVSGRENETVC